MSKQLDHMGVRAFCESIAMMIRSGIQVDEAVSLLQHGKTKTGGLLEESLAVMKERGLQALSRKEKARIKDEMRRRMLPKMPPQLTGSDVALDLSARRLYTDATSKGRIEKLEAKIAELEGKDAGGAK